MHLRNYSSRKQQGFTILEMMVATTVFTVILLIIAVGAISFTNSYFKGITGSKTQAANRSIMSSLAQAIQFGETVNFLSSGSVSGVCVDNTLYAYVVGQQVTDSVPQTSQHQAYHGLLEVPGSSCSAGIPASVITVLGSPGTASLAGLPTGSKELLGAHMRVGTLAVSPLGKLYAIHVQIVYGDDSLLTPAIGATPPNWSQEHCASGLIGVAFCAISDLSTTVGRRLL